MSNLDPVQNMLAKLDGVKQTGDGQYMARCPAHDDAHASLSIGTGDDGRALVHCHASCALGDVLAKIGLTEADLFPAGPTAPAPRADGNAAKGRPRTANAQIVKTYDYKDAAGALLYQSVRYEPKDFRFRRLDGKGDWLWNLGNTPRVLYRLPELLAADKGDWVFVVEGEKDADNLTALGLVATTNPGGAGNWKHLADDSALYGRRVAIIPDKDAPDRKGRIPGADHAQDVAARLHGKAAVVKVIDLPDMPPKDDGTPRKDVSDWVEWLDCKTSEDLAAALVDMAEAAPEWKPPAAARGESAILPTPVLTCLADVRPEPVRWLWPDRIALGKLTVLTGDPGLGKSLITLDMATRVSLGNGFPLCPDGACEPGGVVLLSAEDDAADTIVPRLLAAGADLGRIVKLDAVRIADRQRGFNLDDDLPALEAAIRQVAGCRLVIIDPISAYLGRGIDSHRNAEVRAVLAPLGELAARHGVALVAVMHLNKGQGPAMYRTSGSLGFVAAARAVHVFGKDKADPTGRRRFMLPVKNNLAADRGGLAYRLDFPEGGNGQPVILWEADPVSITADEVLSIEPRRGDEEGAKKREAAAWLRNALAQGPCQQRDILARAENDGICERTLYRAKDHLHVEPYRTGFGAEGGWYWRLPQDPDRDGGGGQAIDCQSPPSTNSLATFGAAGNLWEKPKENGDSQAAPEAPDAKGGQAPETGHLCPDRAATALEPDRPGPTDLLTPDQLRRYRAKRESLPADIDPTEAHAISWREATRTP